MTDRILTSLSIITAFHNKNRSILEAFLPLTEYGIALLCNESNVSHFDTESLKEKIFQSSGILINTITLKSLLKKLKKEKCIELIEQGNYFNVIASFKNGQDEYLAAIRDNHRKVHKFVKEYKIYSNDAREEHEITIWIYDFICEYRRFIDVNNNGIAVPFESDNYRSLLSFLAHINEFESELTEIFHSIYFGANIYSLINNSQVTIAKKELQTLVIYLDSNFILRLMDLQEVAFSAETAELFKTLKDNKIKLMVFNETLDEIKSVLRYYLSIYKNNLEDYSAIVSSTDRISGVLGAYFRRNLSFTQVENMIDNVDRFISENGISIDNLERFKVETPHNAAETLFAIKYDQIDDEEIQLYRMKKCKNYVQIIESIKYLRRKNHNPSSCLGNSKYVFLTCDLKLYKYCRTVTSSYSFPCVISQEILANDLLLFSPTVFNQISFKLLIALYHTSNYIDVHTLDRLKDTIKEVASEDPTEASFIIEATRSCENYSELNKLLNDDVDDKPQLLALAKQRQKLSMETESTIRTQKIKIEESEIAATKAAEKIRALEQKLEEAELKEKMLLKAQKDKQKEMFAKDMKSYVKVVKTISISICVFFAIVTSIVTVLTGLKSWFEKEFRESWWIYMLALVFMCGTVCGAIYNGTDNKWIEATMHRKENALASKYGIDKCDVDDIRNCYWGH